MKKEERKKMKIMIYGAKHSDQHKSFDALEKAQVLGERIAEHEAITLIPSSSGFPFWVAKGTKRSEKGFVLSFSPAANEKEHLEVYRLPNKYQDIIIYSGFGYVGSDLLLSRSSDAIIFGYGGIESVHEFWVAMQEAKPIGILKGDWDRDDVLFNLLKNNEDLDHSRLIFDDDPNRLVERLIKKIKEGQK